MKSPHGTASKHPAKSQRMQELRCKKQFPSIVKLVQNWVQQSETCIRDERIKNTELLSWIQDRLLRIGHLNDETEQIYEAKFPQIRSL